MYSIYITKRTQLTAFTPLPKWCAQWNAKMKQNWSKKWCKNSRKRLMWWANGIWLDENSQMSNRMALYHSLVYDLVKRMHMCIIYIMCEHVYSVMLWILRKFYLSSYALYEITIHRFIKRSYLFYSANCLPPTPSHTVLPYSIPTHFVSLELQFSNGEIHFFITFIRRKNFQQQNENFFFFFHLFNR